MATAKKSPAKTTAPKTATKKTAAKSSTAKKAPAKKKSDLPVQETTPTTKPTAKVKEVKLPFKCSPSETATMKMPNGQTVKTGEMKMLLAALRLESNVHNRVGFDAVKVAKSLLKTDGTAETLWLELRMIIEKNK